MVTCVCTAGNQLCTDTSTAQYCGNPCRQRLPRLRCNCWFVLGLPADGIHPRSASSGRVPTRGHIILRGLLAGLLQFPHIDRYGLLRPLLHGLSRMTCRRVVWECRCETVGRCFTSAGIHGTYTVPSDYMRAKGWTSRCEVKAHTSQLFIRSLIRM